MPVPNRQGHPSGWKLYYTLRNSTRTWRDAHSRLGRSEGRRISALRRVWGRVAAPVALPAGGLGSVRLQGRGLFGGPHLSWDRGKASWQIPPL
jgi:hypothetical protein